MKALACGLYAALLMTLTGCILTDRPIIDAEQSIAPAELLGLWRDPKEETTFLVEALDEHRLRMSIIENGKLVYLGPVHAAKLKNDFIALEHTAGLNLIQLTRRGNISFTETARDTTRAQWEQVAARHKVKLGFYDVGRYSASVKSIGGAEPERVFAFLNDALNRKMIVPNRQRAERINDAEALRIHKDMEVVLERAREEAFTAELRQSDETAKPLERRKACQKWNDWILNGHVEALTQWGKCAAYGRHSTNDTQAAKESFQRARAFGSRDAARELAKLNSKTD